MFLWRFSQGTFDLCYNDGMKLILASASERRRELLSWLGLPFEVRPSRFPEEGIEADDARMLTASLALAKAQTVADTLMAEQMPSVRLDKEMQPQRVEQLLVLGADTVVSLEGHTIGKPRDLDHAREILRRLRGKTHEVYSGVAVVDPWGKRQKAETELTRVAFRNFSDTELEQYLSTSEPLGKAGAYMILGGARGFLERMEGSITNVTGLPLLRVVDLLSEFGVKITVDVAKTIERKTGYTS